MDFFSSKLVESVFFLYCLLSLTCQNQSRVSPAQMRSLMYFLLAGITLWSTPLTRIAGLVTMCIVLAFATGLSDELLFACATFFQLSLLTKISLGRQDQSSIFFCCLPNLPFALLFSSCLWLPRYPKHLWMDEQLNYFSNCLVGVESDFADMAEQMKIWFVDYGSGLATALLLTFWVIMRSSF